MIKINEQNLDGETDDTDEQVDEECEYDDEPIPLTANTVAVPPFPVDALPDVISDMVLELAEATSVGSGNAGHLGVDGALGRMHRWSCRD